MKIRRRGRKVSDRTRAGLSFFQTRIHTDLCRFEFVRKLVQEFACQLACPKSMRGADIMDGMNMIDRIAQTNIQILSIL